MSNGKNDYQEHFHTSDESLLKKALHKSMTTITKVMHLDFIKHMLGTPQSNSKQHVLNLLSVLFSIEM